MTLILGKVIDGGRPHFEATYNGQPVLIEFDAAAILKLAGDRHPERLFAGLEASRAQIRSAAVLLIANGFMDDSRPTPRILVTALDI